MTVCVLFCDGVMIGVFESWALASKQIEFERKLTENENGKYWIQRWNVIEEIDAKPQS